MYAVEIYYTVYGGSEMIDGIMTSNTFHNKIYHQILVNVWECPSEK